MEQPDAGFAKLKGEGFEFYMQSYSITLGGKGRSSSVDIDLFSLGGSMNISCLHTRIYYDFDRKRLALEVLGKTGCYVEGVLYLPRNPPIKLDSQDLLQIGDKKFYFLLPVLLVRSIVHTHVNLHVGAMDSHVSAPGPIVAAAAAKKRSGRPRGAGDEDEDRITRGRFRSRAMVLKGSKRRLMLGPRMK